VEYGHSAVISTKTAEQIEMLFGLWAAMGQGIMYPEAFRDVATATNFGTKVAMGLCER